MSNTLIALQNGDLPAAEKALKEAKKLHPEEPAVKATALRLEEMKTGAELIRLQKKADKLAEEEKWGEALEIYRLALQIDPAAGFAVIGSKESEKRLHLDQAIKEVLANPERLQEDKPLSEARQLLTMMQAIENPGRILQSQISSMDKLITNAAASVEITIRSDNTTTVEIYHVGFLQPFYEKRLSLRPGTYIMVGRRPGYKDIRMTINVKDNESPPLFVFIRCEEPI